MLTNMAAPSKLTPELQANICKLLETGVPICYACDAVGISQASYTSWCRAGKRCDGEIYVAFLAAVKKAKARFIQKNLVRIRSAAREPKTWTAAAWLLERLSPAHFGKKEVELLAEQERRIAALEASLATATAKQ